MKKRYIVDILITLAILLIVIFLSLKNPKPLEDLNFMYLDILLSLKKQHTSDEIILIGIDDKSIISLENLPIQRSKIAEAIKAIESLGAKLVVLDILYSEKDKNPALQEIRNMINRIKEDPTNVIKKDILDLVMSLKISKTEQKRYSDALLNASLSETQKILISILSETEKKIDFDRLFVETISDTKNLLMPIDFRFDKKRQVNPTDIPDYLIKNSLPVICKDTLIREATNIITPLSSFAQKSYGLGHIYLNHDGILRSQDLFICYKDRAFTSISLQAFIKYKNLSLNDVFAQYYKKTTLNNLTKINPSTIYPNFSVITHINYISFIDLLSGRVGENKIQNKIVILGLNTTPLAEQIKVSGGREIPTMFVHAVILQNLIDNAYLIRPSFFVICEILFLLVIALLLFFGIFRYKILLYVNMGLVVVWLAVSAYLVVYENSILQVVYPFILLGLIYPVLMIRKKVYEKESMEKMSKDVFLTKNHRIIIGAKSDIGRVRIKNEDSYCVDKKLGILAVADGVGGNVAGEIASKMAIDKMRIFIRDNISIYKSDLSLLMKQSIEFANTNVYGFSLSNPELRGMATTLTAGFIQDNRLIIGHVGDTRAYLFRNGVLEQLTEDHTVAAEKHIRNLSKTESERMRHVLTRAIGIDEYINVDTFELTLANDDVLLLCSDGLYSMIREQDLISNLKAYNDAEMLCGALINLANKNGGEDNITVITAFIKTLK
ncbi:MAG: CHASE2 domain-containing protein [Thermodesulfovibrionales bacterium]|nr:CHASE2 domain-containing protein [Thermodesulfovibrionales bacterium]